MKLPENAKVLTEIEASQVQGGIAPVIVAAAIGAIGAIGVAIIESFNDDPPIVVNNNGIINGDVNISCK